MSKSLLSFVAILSVWIQGAPARAYVIRSGFTDGCHEWITANAFVESALLDFATPDRVVISEADASRDLSDLLNERLLGGTLSQSQSFVLFSLVVGVRDVDTWGGSVTDIESQRQIHADPHPRGQYVHALRAPEDDEPDGTGNAIAGTRAVIAEVVSAAVDASLKPEEEQLVSVPITLDFYGRFDVEVWEPGFLLGRGVHALQDSFSHSIRSTDGLHQIVHVLNFVDAIYTSFDESRDGIAHSRQLDRCFEAQSLELTDAAQSASVLLFDAFLRVRAGDDPATEAVLDEWLVHNDCNLNDPECVDPKWLEAARTDPSKPLLPKALICSAHPLADRGADVSMVGWVLLGLIAAHGTRGRSSRRDEA